jgi:site-specific DNA recombinase
MTAKPTKAVVYCRVSTKEQTQNLSLPTQLRACRAYCQREGFEVVGEFTDAGESAKTLDRPDFQRLLTVCRDRKQGIQFVVFYNLTRFSRQVRDYAIARSLLQQAGVSLRSVNEPINDDPAGTFTANILAAMAQFENDEKARRTKAGMKAALDLGRWPFQPPLGYLRGGAVRKGLLVPDPVRGPLVRAAFEAFATASHDRNAVLRRMTALGLRSLKGRPLTPQTFSSLLRNPIYAGWVSVPKWELKTRGDFEALVPDALFRRVQRLLDGKDEAPRPHSRNHPDFPLRRFIRCASCNTPLTGSWSTGRSQKYAYYHCRKCLGVKAPKQSLEKHFVELLGSMRPEPGFMELFRAIVLDVWRSKQTEVQKLRARLEEIVREKRQRLDRVEDAFLHEHSIDRTTYERQRDLLRDQIGAAESELNDAVIEQLDVDGVLGFSEHVIENAATLWIHLALNEKQRLQQVLFPEGLTFDGEKFGTAATCLAFKRLEGGGAANSGMASPSGFVDLVNAHWRVTGSVKRVA